MYNIVGASLSKQLLWLHAHEQTELHAEMMSWIASVNECRLCTTLTWSDLNLACKICTVCEQHAVDGRFVATVTNEKVPCVLKLELVSGPSYQLALNIKNLNLKLVCKFEMYVYLRIFSYPLVQFKFTVYGRKQTYTSVLQYSSRVGGEKWPGIYCLHMRKYFCYISAIFPQNCNVYVDCPREIIYWQDIRK